jgi:hypothetical protein
MRRAVHALVLLLATGCASDPEPQHVNYTNEQLHRMPVRQRCDYLIQVIARYMANPTIEEWEKKKFYEAVPAMMRGWGCGWAGQ